MKKRHWTADEKLRILLEAEKEGGLTIRYASGPKES
jgi:hypothetical protein